MSEFTDEISNQYVVCPYCQDEYELDSEDFNEEERIELCDNCGKKFHHVDEIEHIHQTRPDCAINGITHTWKFNDRVRRDYCEVCDEIKPKD